MMTSSDGDGGGRGMSLFNKYATMSEEITATRAKRDGLEEEIINVQHEEGHLKKQELRFRASTQEAVGRAANLEEQIKKAEDKYQTAKSNLRHSSLEEERTKRESDALNDIIFEQRQSFLEDSRKFQSNTHRLRLQATVLGLEHASTQAFALVNGFDGDIYEKLGDSGVVVVDADDLDDDPSTWTVLDERDDETNERQKAYLEEKARLVVAQEMLHESQQQRQLLLDYGSTLRERKAKSQAQSDRIGKDNAELELQIQEMQRLLHESQQMAKNPAASSVTPSPPNPRSVGNHQSFRGSGAVRPTHNPYAKNANQTSSTYSSCRSNLSSTRRSDIQATVLGMGGTSASSSSLSLLQHQQPHRQGGRIRRDRQFGVQGYYSHLHVAGGEETANTNSNSAVDDDAGETNAMNSGAFAAASSLQNESTSMLHLDDDMSDDDDDDDDGLLSYVAFK